MSTNIQENENSFTATEANAAQENLQPTDILVNLRIPVNTTYDALVLGFKLGLLQTSNITEIADLIFNAPKMVQNDELDALISKAMDDYQAAQEQASQTPEEAEQIDQSSSLETCLGENGLVVEC